ncbi:hypothetical protein ABID42_003437 [Arcicella rosea]
MIYEENKTRNVKPMLFLCFSNLCVLINIPDIFSVAYDLNYNYDYVKYEYKSSSCKQSISNIISGLLDIDCLKFP